MLIIQLFQSEMLEICQAMDFCALLTKYLVVEALLLEHGPLSIIKELLVIVMEILHFLLSGIIMELSFSIAAGACCLQLV